jgi:aromatic ring-opening dioxygenase catalytic subunit (LigB family)
LHASPGILYNPNEPDAALRLVTVAAVDVKRAANLYAQGRTLRQMCEERAGQRLTISGSSYADLLRACSS